MSCFIKDGWEGPFWGADIRARGASEWPEGIWRKRLTGRDNGRYKDREEGRSMVCPKYGTAAWVTRVEGAQTEWITWKARERNGKGKCRCSVMSDSLRPHGLWPTRLLCPWDSPGKNTGEGCHFLLQGIFLTQGSNSGLPHFMHTLYHLSHQGSRDKWD